MPARPGLLGALLVGLFMAAGGWLAVAAWKPPPGLSQAMVVSVSADGRYAISSHRERELVLWDIEARSHRVMSRKANVYSAYFVPGRDAFLWQDLGDTVRVSAIDGRELLRFEHFPTYGHVISPDLATYVSSDQGWGIYLGTDPSTRPIKATDGRAFLGYGKLLNLQFSTQSALLLSAGDGLLIRDRLDISDSQNPATDTHLSDYNGVVLWDLTTGQPVHKLSGNSAKAHATLSPNGRFVVSVDENANAFVWDALKGKLILEQALLGMGVYVGGEELGSPRNWDTNGMRVQPNDLPKSMAGSAQLGVHFLDSEHYVILHTYQPYAVLYILGEPFALKILPLGEDPFPSVSSYLRNAAIDSAPQAGILVTGQRQGGGINVYRFDRRARSLQRIWAPTP